MGNFFNSKFAAMEMLFAGWLAWSWLQAGAAAGAVAAFSILSAFIRDHEEDRRTNASGGKWLLLAIFSLAWGIGAIWWMPRLWEWASTTGVRSPVAVAWVPGSFPWLAWLGGAIAATALWVGWNRILPARSERFRSFMRKKTATAREGKTDIRTVAATLPQPAASFDPRDFFRDSQIFIGLNERRKPLNIPYEIFKKCHIQLAGTTGSGKGRDAQGMLSGAIRAGEAVVVMDPKFDEWMPFAMAQEANAAGVPFVLMDLRKDWPQINLLAGASAADVEELLVAGLGLSDKGGEGDFYRVSDRRAAASLAQAILAANSRATLADLAEAAQADDGLVKNAAGLVGRLAEIAATPALSAYAGPDLAATLAAGGVVYILGSMRHGRILAAQRMILVRLMQIIEQRPRDDDAPPARRVCIFLDELKAHISRPALEMLGAIRDKGAHLIVAHQAVADLRDVPADLDKEAVVGAIVENCAIRVVYRIQDPATRTWIASMSGKILVDDETRQVETSAALVERQSGNRSLRQTDRFKIDENQLAALPDGVAVVFVGTTTQFAHICAIPTKKTGLRIVRGKPRPEPIAVPAGGADGGQVDDWKVTKGGDE